MTEKSINMEMANLICRFGENVLLDFAEDIVIPSFLDSSLVRKYDQTSYFFYDVEFVTFEGDNEEVLGVVGRLIKDTTLEREQIFTAKEGLVQNPDSIRSSPSSIFMLILNNHRLLYVRETPYAPTKEMFRATLLKFIKEKRKQLINKEYSKALQEAEKKVTKKALFEKIPAPTLELVPLTSGERVEAFVRRYETLKYMEILFPDRNDETDNDPFFEELQRRKDYLGSKRSSIEHRNSEGLDKSKVVSEIGEATVHGNQKVKLSGVDSNGDQLRGNNEEFELRKPLDDFKKTPKEAAIQLYQAFQSLIEERVIRVQPSSDDVKSTISRIAGKVKNE